MKQVLGLLSLPERLDKTVPGPSRGSVAGFSATTLEAPEGGICPRARLTSCHKWFDYISWKKAVVPCSRFHQYERMFS